MLKLNLIVIIALSAFLFTGCDKDSAKTKTELIAQGSWKFDKATSNGSDVTAFINACYKDNVVTFAANGTGSFDEGATKCNGADPQTMNFTWSFTTNETVLNVSGAIFAGQSGNFTIITLNETDLVLEGTITTGAGNVTGQLYFKH